MMDLHQNKLSQGIIGHLKDEYQLVVYLFILILVVLCCIMHCYCHLYHYFYHYGLYNNDNFLLFFYLFNAWDLLSYTFITLKQSVASLDRPPTLAIASVQSLPSAHCAYLVSVWYVYMFSDVFYYYTKIIIRLLLLTSIILSPIHAAQPISIFADLFGVQDQIKYSLNLTNDEITTYEATNYVQDILD